MRRRGRRSCCAAQRRVFGIGRLKDRFGLFDKRFDLAAGRELIRLKHIDLQERARPWVFLLKATPCRLENKVQMPSYPPRKRPETDVDLIRLQDRPDGGRDLPQEGA